MKKNTFLITFLFLLLCGTAAAQPSISSLSASTLPRSGRLLIQGSGFGAAERTSQVSIGGLSAIVTRWSDGLIAAYVPEATAVGATSVQVIVGGVASNGLPLTVTLRQSNGRVKWRFQADSDYIFQRPAVGLDGTIVAHDSNGFVYALTRDGGLKWIFRTRLFSYGPPSIAADGTVFVASSETIYAINPDGTLKWTFSEPPGGQGVTAGPTVGPDGNIYAVTDLGGLGALSLSPAGQLRWSNPGTPAFSQNGQLGAEIVFGSSRPGGALDQFYVASDNYSSSTDARNHLFAFRLTGEQMWTVPLFQSKSFMQGQQQPAVGPDGTVFETAILPTGGNWALNAFNPANGAVLRTFTPSPGSSGMSAPDIGPDGTAYFAHSLSYLLAISPSGAPRWQFFDGSMIIYPVVGPNNDMVIAASAPNYGMPDSIRSFSTANGEPLWSVDLGVENGGNQVMESRPRFDVTGNAVYFGTFLAGATGADTYCYLYALDTGGAASSPTLTSLSLTPNSLTGGNGYIGQVTLSAPALAGGAVISLSSNNSAVATVPATVSIPQGATSASFNGSTSSVTAITTVTISAIYAGVTKTATLTVAPAVAGDTVAIKTAQYTLSKRRLNVQATSTNSTATLKVYVTATGELIGTLTNQGGGKYQGQFVRSTNPVNITVRSSLGGVASSNVIVK